jgi:enoyl-CoA hydratase/carnithine racemase
LGAETGEAARAIDTGTDKLLCRVEGRVAIVTLNDPEQRNPLGAALRPPLRRLVDRIAADPGIRCLLLTGAGGAFCAGGDAKAMASDRQPGTAERIRAIKWEHAAAAVIHEMDKPSIAALPGPAAGAGFGLALACDLRLAAESAFLTSAYARLGLSGDYGLTWFLTRLVGPARAREICFRSARIPAREAERIGLVNHVVPDERLQAEALALARELADAAPLAVRYLKANLNDALDRDLRACLDREAERQCLLADSEDFREATRAFVEKRAPLFRGR